MKYYAKRPADGFAPRTVGYSRSLLKAADRIETESLNSSEPWLQLVEETKEGWRVVAEYRNHGARGWIGPLEAAGLK